MGLRLGRSRSVGVCALASMWALLGACTLALPAQGAEGQACTYEAQRVEQGIAYLPDCRAYEQVSPAEKGGGDIVGEGFTTKASDAGDALAFESRLNFGDSIGSGTVGRTTYVARRGAGGWTTHSVTPMPQPEVAQVLFGSTRVEIFADDLSNAFVWAYDLPAVTDDVPQRENLYAEDTFTGALRTVSKTQAEPLRLFDFLNTEFDGYSADAKHIAFVTSTKMLPEAASTGYPNLYKWDDGVLSLAGVLPNGSLPPTGATVFPDGIEGAMSRDGTRLVFDASPDGSAPAQLYLHVDGKPTVWVSEPRRGNGDMTPASGIVFEGMTPDGNNVFFSSKEPLVDADTAPGPDIYRFTYDPATGGGSLTLITNDGNAVNASGFGGTLVGMSDDARRVYLHESGGTLDLWQEGVPGLTTVDPSAPRESGQANWLTLVASEPGKGRVSPDGNWLAYIKGPYIQEGQMFEAQMYVYHRGDPAPTCVSCPSDATVQATVTNGGGRHFPGFRPRFLSDDGKVFFTSTGSLVPADRNGVADVYEYDGPTKTLSLLTSGRGTDPAMFVDASRSGDDVFVVTRAKLVKSDGDNYVDVYDVRVGAAPVDQLAAAPACEGDACQGALTGSPPENALGSFSLDSGGEESSRAGARLTVRHRVTFHGSSGLLSVKLSPAGRIAWSGRGLASGSLRRASAGTAGLRLRLGKSARAALARSGHYTTTVRLTFHAADGTATTTVHVTFRGAGKGR